jgi:ABC-type uncharacterized transport system substrate-binding protein
VLTQPAVPQYAEVVAGFREVRGSTPVDVADEAGVQEALGKRPDIVVAVGSKALEVARSRAEGAIIVAAAVLSPDPGRRGEVTAVPMESRAQDAARALAAIAPGAKRVLLLHPPNSRAALADARAAARAAGLELEPHELADLHDFQALFRRLAEGRDAIWLLPDPRLAKPDVVKFLVTSCLERRVPLVGFLDGMTRTGALLSVSADFRAIGREAARLAADVEARPPEARAGVPFRFAPGKLSVNVRVREMLGLPGRVPEGAEVVR